jgi:hypothetical protein
MWLEHPRPSLLEVVVTKELTPVGLRSDSYGNISVIHSWLAD